MKKLVISLSFLIITTLSYSNNNMLFTIAASQDMYTWGGTITAAYQKEYLLNENEKRKVSGGPTVGINLSLHYPLFANFFQALAKEKEKEILRFVALVDVGYRLDFLYKNKVYTGLELGLQMGYQNTIAETAFYYRNLPYDKKNKDGVAIQPFIYWGSTFNVHIGKQVTDKTKVGAFIGFGRGSIGMEVLHKF